MVIVFLEFMLIFRKQEGERVKVLFLGSFVFFMGKNVVYLYYWLELSYVVILDRKRLRKVSVQRFSFYKGES